MQQHRSGKKKSEQIQKIPSRIKKNKTEQIQDQIRLE